MQLKLDENLGHRVAQVFRTAGHDVEMARAEGLCGCADAEVLAACQREERGLVTLDLDFSNPLVFEPTLVKGLEQGTIAGKLWSVERWRIREYRPDRPGEAEEGDDA